MTSNSHIYFRPFYIIGIMISLMLMGTLHADNAHAGLFSALGKLGKAAKSAKMAKAGGAAVGAEAMLAKIGLPDELAGLSPAMIKPDMHGKWQATLPDGSTAAVDDLIRQGADHAFVIRHTDLPPDMDALGSLPGDAPLLVAGKNNRVFGLHRSQPSNIQGNRTTEISYGPVRVQADSMGEVKDLLWQLQRPAMGKTARFIRLDDKTGITLPKKAYGSNVGVETVSMDNLIASMSSLKQQTLVISGRMADGRLLPPGNKGQGISLQRLREAAEANDIQLTLIDSPHPKAALNRLSKSMRQANQDGSILHDSIGDFYRRLADPANPEPIRLQAGRSGEQQLSIQWQPARETSVPTGINTADSVTAEDLMHFGLHTMVHSAVTWHQDQARAQELEARIIPGLPFHSYVQYYLLFSGLLGFIAFRTSWKLWERFFLSLARFIASHINWKTWPWKLQKKHRYLLIQMIAWLIVLPVFIVFFIPVFGVFSFLWLVVELIVKTINLLLVRPMRWVYRKVS